MPVLIFKAVFQYFGVSWCYRISTDACADYDHYCEEWVADGDCENDKQYMEENCRKSCGLCTGERRIDPERRQKPRMSLLIVLCTIGKIPLAFWVLVFISRPCSKKEKNQSSVCAIPVYTVQFMPQEVRMDGPLTATFNELQGKQRIRIN